MKKKCTIMFMFTLFLLLFSLSLTAMAASCGDYRINIDSADELSSVNALFASDGVLRDILTDDLLLERDGVLLYEPDTTYTGSSAFLKAEYVARGAASSLNDTAIDQLLSDLTVSYENSESIKWIRMGKNSSGQVALVQYSTAVDTDKLWTINTPHGFDLNGETTGIATDHVFQVQFSETPKGTGASGAVNKVYISSGTSSEILAQVRYVNDQIVTLFGEEKLSYNSNYILWVREGLQNSEESDSISADKSYSFSTEPYFNAANDNARTTGTIYLRAPYDLKESSITNAKFVLLADGSTQAVETTVEYKATANLIAVSHSQALESNTVYSVVVSPNASLEKEDGQMVDKEVLRFATAP